MLASSLSFRRGCARILWQPSIAGMRATTCSIGAMAADSWHPCNPAKWLFHLAGACGILAAAMR
jgi:hypothetical protein